jgi:predicted amidohydrolase
LIVGLASPRVAVSLDDALAKMDVLLADAAGRGAEIVCFPEAYVPGLRGDDFEAFPFDAADERRARSAIRDLARTHAVAVIAGIEQIVAGGRQIAALVVDARGEVLGCQTKNQLDPSEERFYVPGTERRVFEVNGTRFGIAICHEGWRYPETVRWAAVRGAKIVFHPQRTGPRSGGVRLTGWGSPSAPYYEKAMLMRSIENTIWFASVNYALEFQESATTLVTPEGEPFAHLPYGEEGVLVAGIDLARATGLLAKRYAPERYIEGS